MGYSQFIVTEAGQELLVRAMTGETSIQISKVSLSNETHSSFNEKDSVIPPIEITEDKKVLAKAIFSNVDVTEGYDVNCIGVFAKDNNGNEIFFSYSDGSGDIDRMSVFDGESPFALHYNIFTGIIADGGIVVNINKGSYATEEDLNRKWEKHSVPTKAALPTPDGSHQAVDEVWYVEDKNERYVENKKTDESYSLNDISYTDEATEPTATIGAYYHNTTTDKWYKSRTNANPLKNKEFVTVDTLPIGGTYVNDTLIRVDNGVDAVEFYKANATVTDDYEDLTSIYHEVASVLDIELVDGDYYFVASSNTLYHYIKYEWEEIEVNVVDTFPEPSIDTVDKYYYDGSNLKFGTMLSAEYEWELLSSGSGSVIPIVDELPEPSAKWEGKYVFFRGELYICKYIDGVYKWEKVGGGGGDFGDYAFLQITYDVGETCSVTYNGITKTAPDTSGYWMCGVAENGTYTITMGSKEVTADITYEGQIKKVIISKQTINYATLYLLGDENSELTGGWNDGVWNTGLGEAGNRNGYRFSTTGTINNNDYDGCFFTVKPAKYSALSFDISVRGYTDLGFVGNIVRSLSYSSSSSLGRKLLINTLTTKTNKKAVFDFFESSSGSYYWEHKKKANCLFAQQRDQGNSHGMDFSLYAFIMYKTDDISALSEYGATETEIINNATNLFADESALNWMVLNCTGSFMFRALSNSTFVSIMKASPNYTIIQANEHWAKFLPLLSV